jgi:hypothetical protein
MNILKSSYLNSTTLKKIENFDRNFFFMVYFLYVYNFMKKLSLNVVLLSPFVRIAKMFQGFANQNNILFDYYIIHMCIDFTT